MSKSDETWSEVGEGFKKIGSMFKQHYESQAAGEGAEAVSEEDVKDAVQTLGESIKTAFATIGDAVADPEVQSEAKQTAKSFVDALGASFSDLGDQISKWRAKGGTGEPPSRTDAAPAEPTEPPTTE
ncbi:MAG: hypothetical protein P1T08_14310 [Acidimicrobiia bacterium]|nr:hypothetical protein [Acidimicrobiia bacterium]